MSEKQKIIILTGPTAAGKTDLSIRLAGQIGGEIISADSMQVYKYMDIGSAKIMPEEMNGIPHHLVDILDPREDFDVYTFQTLAKEAMEKIRQRGHIPIVVGGTGFYIQALLYDIAFADNPETEEGTLRRELEKMALEKGNMAVYERLMALDPQSAADIHPNNIKRVI
ncbi:MAG: tRNA (adenosine(37)-N6)-dimethylallyltransferase MiaA, partial [Lachnospiraceae bacterium]|nr:tRNA (adenosine(37)-N6)-dimethylallyltransferase MiaA [Lachnospiraceae bacterium]